MSLFIWYKTKHMILIVNYCATLPIYINRNNYLTRLRHVFRCDDFLILRTLKSKTCKNCMLKPAGFCNKKQVLLNPVELIPIIFCFNGIIKCASVM